MSVYREPNTFKYDSTAITGVLAVRITEGGALQSSYSDGATHSHWLAAGPVRFTVTLNDEAEARKLSGKVAATKNVTFQVNDETDTDAGTVTLANAKTGPVYGGYDQAGGTAWCVDGVCDTASDPT